MALRTEGVHRRFPVDEAHEGLLHKTSYTHACYTACKDVQQKESAELVGKLKGTWKNVFKHICALK